MQQEIALVPIPEPFQRFADGVHTQGTARKTCFFVFGPTSTITIFMKSVLPRSILGRPQRDVCMLLRTPETDPHAHTS
eukprot:9490136-Pyramimonas_sp.AAC.2